jgi:hypothetical protein
VPELAERNYVIDLTLRRSDKGLRTPAAFTSPLLGRLQYAAVFGRLQYAAV